MSKNDKRGRGRPARSDKVTRLYVNINESVYNKFKEKCREEGRTLTSSVERIIKKYVE